MKVTASPLASQYASLWFRFHSELKKAEATWRASVIKGIIKITESQVGLYIIYYMILYIIMT